MLESTVGALYASDGFSLEGAEKFFQRVLWPFFEKHVNLRTLAHHPTKILFELLQGQGCQKFELVKRADQGLTGVANAQCDGMHIVFALPQLGLLTELTQ
jgi:dsRNA-specific ribonuclease